MLSVLHTVIHRDLLLALRRRADVATVLLFFVIVVSLFPLGIGPEPNLLRAIAPGVIWVAALLSCMLALARLFAADFADGTLEQMLVSPTPLGLIVAGKVAAHWVTSGLPLVLIAPVLAIQFDLNQSLLGVLALSLLIGTPVLSLIGAIGAALTLGIRGGGVLLALLGVLALSLLIGTPVLSLIGAIGAALTLGLRGGGVLLALLVLPLYVPVLIIGAGALDAAAAGQSAQPHFLLLAALLVLAAAFTPWAIAASLRISSE